MTAPDPAVRAVVQHADLVAGFERLGLRDRPVMVHTSLKSLGHVDGGAATVARALAGVASTVLAPAFNFDSNCPPPPGDRPAQNGADYAFYDNWSKPRIPWVKETARIDPKMGAVPQAVRELPGALRSDHPWHSWVAYGPDAARLVEPHPWTLTNPEVDRLAAMASDVVFIGVGLTSCTAAHVAEERAGRRPFIRWNVDRDDRTRRIRVAGCSKGFDRLWPSCADLFRADRIGGAIVRVAPLEALIERLAETIREQPAITVCATTCLRCRDAVLGGPADTA